MKCTQCGCKEFILSELPFQVRGYDVKFEVNASLKVHYCLECGHLEWFDKSLADNYRSDTALLNHYTTELADLKEQLKELENPKVLKNYETELEDIEKKLSSLDITIRQQQELQTQRSEAQYKIRSYPNNVENLNQKIKNLERDIETLKEKIPKVVVVGD